MTEDLQKFLEYLEKEKKYSAHTLRAYKDDISSFYFFLNQSQIEPSEVQYDEIRAWIVSLSEEGMINRSINRKISALKTYYTFLQKIKKIEVSPLQMHRSLKTEKKIQIPFSVKEIDKVRELLEKEGSFESYRDLLIVEMLYGLGLRRSELCGIKESDVDFGLKVIKIRGKGGKERLMPLIQELGDKIKKYLIIKKEYFNSTYKATNLLVNNKANKVDENFVYRVINNYFSDATTKEKKSPHMLRHSFATHLLENGADINSIKELMGHASLASTQVYAQINLKELKKVYQKAHPRMKK